MDAGGRRRGDGEVRSGPFANMQFRSTDSVSREGGMYRLSDTRVHTVQALVRRAEGLEGDAFTGRCELLIDARTCRWSFCQLDLRGHHAQGVPRTWAAGAATCLSRSEHPQAGGAPVVASPSAARVARVVYLCRAYDDRGPRGSGRRSSGRGLYGEGGRLAAHEGPEELEPTSELGRIYTFSLKDGLVTDGDADFELAPYDIVEVRRSPATGSSVALRWMARRCSREAMRW